MNFKKMMQPVKRDSLFTKDGLNIWCGSIVRYRNEFYMLYSEWDKSSGDLDDWGWCMAGRIGVARSSAVDGPYEDCGIVFAGAGGTAWDAAAVHNPCCLCFDGRYYMYYMGACGCPEDRSPFAYWKTKQIGVAVADHPLGPWERADAPILRSEEGTWTQTLVSNPAVCMRPDGRFLMVYKGAGPCRDNDYTTCLFTCGVALAESPVGPFKKIGGPQFLVPGELWSVEDPCIWYDKTDRRFYCVIKEFHGYYNRTGKQSNSLFESEDGMIWKPSKQPLAYSLELEWEDHVVESVENLERPMVYCEEGIPLAMCSACRLRDGTRGNVQFRLDRHKA